MQASYAGLTTIRDNDPVTSLLLSACRNNVQAARSEGRTQCPVGCPKGQSQQRSAKFPVCDTVYFADLLAVHGFGPMSSSGIPLGSTTVRQSLRRTGVVPDITRIRGKL